MRGNDAAMTSIFTIMFYNLHLRRSLSMSITAIPSSRAPKPHELYKPHWRPCTLVLSKHLACA